MYNIGLDIGTGSVGWCLTDENGYLLKVNRKGNNGNTYRNSAWGVRLFESADTAADCRIKRSTRRRYKRRRTRIIELRKIMSDMIMPIDPNFYARLDEAFLWNEDKSDKAKAPFLLFNDNGYDDVKYYTDYPTIYHLRKHLLETKEKADPRFIYLALHHMMKYRGHFLFEGQSFEAIDNIEDTFIVLAIFGIFGFLIAQIVLIISKNKIQKYINKNGYKEELVHQLDNCVEEKHYKNKIILTKDFFVDLKSSGGVVFKYSDVKWVHIHNVKYYGVMTVSSSIIVHLRDGKTQMRCVEIKGNSTEEFLDIFNKICEKAPADCLKGYTKENLQEFRQYKKDLKINKL